MKANTAKPIPYILTIWKKVNICAIWRDTKTFATKLLKNANSVVWEASTNHLDILSEISTALDHSETDLKRLSRRKKKEIMASG